MCLPDSICVIRSISRNRMAEDSVVLLPVLENKDLIIVTGRHHARGVRQPAVNRLPVPSWFASLG